MELANHPEQIGVAVSCDDDDMSMLRNLVQEEITRTVQRSAWNRIFFGPNKTKIQACNADMDKIDWPWDIVVLVSDDMIPQVKGYDDVIRSHMIARFPDTNGILWFNDGYQGDKLNTLCVFGRRKYEWFGYLYHPSYKSLFCDTELTDLCKGVLSTKCLYIPTVIIRHEHPGTGYAQNMDALYIANQRFWNDDMYTYIDRKTYEYDWSVLIATIPGREDSLRNLCTSIREKVDRLRPNMKIEICIAHDNREMSIGNKRQLLLNQAKGKYLSFIDDDDEITDAYIEDLWECIQGKHQVMRLRGQMSGYSFVHSTATKLTDKMATMTDPPVFVRPPNHLNPMMSDVAKFIQFKNATYGEDLEWTLQLLRAGFLTNEFRSEPDSRVHYIYNLGERAVPPSVAVRQQSMTYEEMLQLIFTPVTTPAPTPAGPTKLRLGAKGFVST